MGLPWNATCRSYPAFGQSFRDRGQHLLVLAQFQTKQLRYNFARIGRQSRQTKRHLTAALPQLGFIIGGQICTFVSAVVSVDRTSSYLPADCKAAERWEQLKNDTTFYNSTFNWTVFLFFDR